MPPPKDKSTILTLRVKVKLKSKMAFVDWQSQLNSIITLYPGFISLEILSPMDELQNEWVLVERFQDDTDVSLWLQSDEHEKVMTDLGQIVDAEDIKEERSGISDLKGDVTEIFVTQVSPQNEDAYRTWIAKIHQVEAKFPGFKGMYVQSPPKKNGNWITFLRFDNSENLDRWLTSTERKKILKDAESLIASLESHRMISPFAGWFASISKQGKMPPVWKQTLLVLLVLFPIVALELIFLSPC